MDALNKLVWVDDAQVVRLTASKRYATSHRRPLLRSRRFAVKPRASGPGRRRQPRQSQTPCPAPAKPRPCTRGADQTDRGDAWKDRVLIHYHGTPITPIAALYQLSGRHFCVSHAHPADVARCHQIGQSVMLDNGAFSAWKAGKATDWPGYYAWADRWLDCPTTWAVIPDVIDGSTQLQRRAAGGMAARQAAGRASLAWTNRLRACCGWSKPAGRAFASGRPQNTPWCCRMLGRRAWTGVGRIATTFARAAAPHAAGDAALRHAVAVRPVDSADIARNHCRDHNAPRAMADRWDAMQTPHRWTVRARQMELA